MIMKVSLVFLAFLDSLRPPGSPLVKMTDLSFNDGGESGCGDEADAKSGAVTAMDVTSLDVELERVKVTSSPSLLGQLLFHPKN